MKKETLKKVFCLTLSGLLCFSTAACGDTGDGDYNYTRVEPDYSAYVDTDIMHIAGWVAPKPAANANEVDYCTQEQYNYIAESGLNAIYGLYEPWGMIKNGKNANERALEYAQNAGIKFYIRDFNVSTGLAEEDETLFHRYFDKYLAYDSFGGALVIDEPPISEFENIKTLKTNWDKFIPNKHFYVNLNPIIQSFAYLGLMEGESYQEHYVRRFINECTPPVLSFDNYPMKQDGWGDPSLLPEFLLNLQICAEEAEKAGIPLWCFIQNYKYGNGMRDTDASEIRFQIMCSMAYGIKGYQYFCYFTPSGDSNLDESQSAMISATGERTQHYYDCQTVNREILAMDHVYLNYDWEGTMLVLGEGHKKNKCFSMVKNALQSHDRILSVSASQDTLVGTFKDAFDNDAFMVVNFDDPAHNSTDTVTIDLKGTSKAVVYEKGVRTEVNAPKGKLTLNIEAGSGAFVIPLQ